MSCILSDGVHPVDFTNLNVVISHSFNNPALIDVATPLAAGETLGSNTIGINIGFVQNNINLSFYLTDGPGTYNFISPTTNYEKLVYMANYVHNAKTLTLGSSVFHCHITSMSINCEPGKKDLSTNGNITLMLSKDIAMDSATAPTVTLLTPTSGPTGTSVTITGTGFTGGSVTFGGVSATCTVNSATQITATAPTHAAGAVYVVVTTVSGSSATGAASTFTYT